MADLHPEARKLNESDRLAHMVTMNPDGTPQVSCIWVGLEGDEIVSGHLPLNRKVRNVQSDSRVVLSIEGGGMSGGALRHYLVVRGTARVQEGGAAELLQRLAHVYLGPDIKFPPIDDPPPGYVIRTTPERLSGVGPWAEG
jgi:PPOX class probable F420-dependent enzyme